MSIVDINIDKLEFSFSEFFKKRKPVDTIIDTRCEKFHLAGEQVELIRNEVASDFKEKKLISSHESIRANVFLPTANRDAKGHTYVLEMHPVLMKNMNHEGERNLRLCLTQGLTGEVFGKQSCKICREIHHRLSDEQAKYVHPGLSWWASFPLMSKEHTIIGVLNVDGIEFDLPKSEESNLINLVKGKKNKLEEELNKLPKLDLFLYYRPHKD